VGGRGGWCMQRRHRGGRRWWRGRGSRHHPRLLPPPSSLVSVCGQRLCRGLKARCTAGTKALRRGGCACQCGVHSGRPGRGGSPRPDGRHPTRRRWWPKQMEPASELALISSEAQLARFASPGGFLAGFFAAGHSLLVLTHRRSSARHTPPRPRTLLPRATPHPRGPAPPRRVDTSPPEAP
jgi:hypothetical protein